ncbi:MAG: hypothetical protein RIQ47_1022 [Bacteroidota bacterium]|jgi:hypothetical protein
MRYLVILSFYLSVLFNAQAQTDTLRVLFLGNSYTQYYSLPQMVANLSASAGVPMIVDSYTPGGYTFSGHANDAVSLGKIQQGNWDYVVIQEQSQVPTVDYFRYNDMYPGAFQLRDAVLFYNPCATVVTFMTWGRRFGGQQCLSGFCSPVFTDFNHMQDSLQSAYEEISELIGARCAPVGVAWKNILADTTLILHAADNSHPSPEGSYVAACAIYSTLSYLPSAGLSYVGGLTAASGLYLQQQSDNTVFGSISDWNLYVDQPSADFFYSINGNDVQFIDLSVSNNALSYTWNFGDGTIINGVTNPMHSYTSNGTYTVTLVVESCDRMDTVQYDITIGTTGLNTLMGKNKSLIYPNPVSDKLQLKTEPATIGALYLINDVLGNTIQKGFVDQQELQIDVRHLSGGVYFLQLGEQVFRFVRE